MLPAIFVGGLLIVQSLFELGDVFVQRGCLGSQALVHFRNRHGDKPDRKQWCQQNTTL